MMRKIKQLGKGDVLTSIRTAKSGVIDVSYKLTNDCYAVVDSSGNVIADSDGYLEIYSEKAIAQDTADMYNMGRIKQQ